MSTRSKIKGKHSKQITVPLAPSRTQKKRAQFLTYMSWLFLGGILSLEELPPRLSNNIKF